MGTKIKASLGAEASSSVRAKNCVQGLISNANAFKHGYYIT